MLGLDLGTNSIGWTLIKIGVVTDCDISQCNNNTSRLKPKKVNPIF